MQKHLCILKNVHHILSGTVNYSETHCAGSEKSRNFLTQIHRECMESSGTRGVDAIPLTIKIEIEDVDLPLNHPIRTCPQYSRHMFTSVTAPAPACRVCVFCLSRRSCDGAGDDVGVRVPTSRSGAEAAASDRT